MVEGERVEALYVLALTTGLRRGELLALRWEDLDIASRQLHVHRAMQRVNGRLQTVEPKTTSSRRTVVLPGWQYAIYWITKAVGRRAPGAGRYLALARLGVRFDHRDTDRAA